jgi:hypothetical protein
MMIAVKDVTFYFRVICTDGEEMTC